METLHVESLKKNKHLAPDISKACWYTFTVCMKYKCERYEIDFQQVPWNYPSSKTCSNCGHYHKDLKMTKDRKFVCPECGYIEDRDINAATNLMNYYK